MYDICIIGAGITGLGLLLLFQEAGVAPSRIAIVDPHFDGGDLARRWTTVPSNTPWSKTAGALREACPAAAAAAHPLLNFKDPEASTPLADIAELLRTAAAPLLRSALQVQGAATRAEYSSPDRRWTVWIGDRARTLEARTLVFAQGAEPRTFDLPIPSIPLDIALDGSRLRHYLRAGQRVMVFGTMHSGTLVMRNAVDCKAGAVIGLYNTPHPFTWDRDGAYDGIKREAADVADAIVAGQLPVELISTQDTAAVIRASATADWVIYAMGFQPRRIPLKVDGTDRDSAAYDGATGALLGAPAAWGFGVAYPNRAPDGVHWDVSVAAFLAHMKRQLPRLLEQLEKAT